jgi:hypothetical protein
VFKYFSDNVPAEETLTQLDPSIGIFPFNPLQIPLLNIAIILSNFLHHFTLLHIIFSHP